MWHKRLTGALLKDICEFFGAIPLTLMRDGITLPEKFILRDSFHEACTG